MAMTKKRNNRLWLPENKGIQPTMILCEECGEAYEPEFDHVCREENSYPIDLYTKRGHGQ